MTATERIELYGPPPTRHDGAMAEPQDTRRSPTLDKALERREDLLAAIGAVELAISAPTARERWLEDVHKALGHLKRAFHAHLDVTEGEEGLFADVMGVAPRLAHEIDKLRTEHDEIEHAMDRALGVQMPIQLRDEATSLLGRLVRHRQRGADLLYEAYDVDVSVGD